MTLSAKSPMAGQTTQAPRGSLPPGAVDAWSRAWSADANLCLHDSSLRASDRSSLTTNAHSHQCRQAVPKGDPVADTAGAGAGVCQAQGSGRLLRAPVTTLTRATTPD